MSATAGTFFVFGPEGFGRGDGEPQTVRRSFAVADPSLPYRLRIDNGAGGQVERVSSAVITLNGAVVVGPKDLNRQIETIEKPVALAAANELAVEIRSAPGSGLRVAVLGTENEPPTIVAEIEPPPNDAGWNRTELTVRFACSDRASGVASCPQPVPVTAETDGRVISGTAFDEAGNQAMSR